MDNVKVEAKRVYIGTASGYENCTLCRAFATKAQAQAWVKACNEYDANPKRPRYPDDVDSITDAEFEKLSKKMDRWQKRHPSGTSSYDDRWGYQEMKVELAHAVEAKKK